LETTAQSEVLPREKQTAKATLFWNVVRAVPVGTVLSELKVALKVSTGDSDTVGAKVKVGRPVGVAVGDDVVGEVVVPGTVGIEVGLAVGLPVGPAVGADVTAAGLALGAIDGADVPAAGLALGAEVATTGLALGAMDGLALGVVVAPSPSGSRKKTKSADNVIFKSVTP